MPYPPNLCASVPICGRCFSARRFCAFRGFCGNIVSHGFHRSTQMVGCVNSPTEFTDLHGWFGCVGSPTEFTEFTEVWGAVGCVGTAGCHTLLICAHPCQSVGGASLPEGSVCSVRSVGDIPACFVSAVLALVVGNAELILLDSAGSVGTAGCHTLLICAHLCQSVGGASLPEGSVCSVRSVGGTSLPEGSVCSVRSVGGNSQPEE